MKGHGCGCRGDILRVLRSRRLGLVLLFATALLSVGPAVANAAEPRQGNQGTDIARGFALGIATLKEYGFGTFLRLRRNFVAAEGGIGAMPVIIMESSGRCGGAELELALHAGGALVFFFDDHESEFQNGIKLGGFYNSTLRPGGWLGWHGEWTMSSSFALSLSVGIQVYPGADDVILSRLRESCPSGSDPSPSWGMVQPYVGLSMLFYLF